MTLVYLRRQFWCWCVPVMALFLCVSVAWTHPAQAQTTSANSGPQWYPMVRPNLDSSSIVFDPKNPNIVYNGGTSGVFKSIDGGRKWRTINNGLTNVSINILAIDPVTTTTIYAGTDGGVFRSIDGGANWVEINTNIPDTKVNYHPTRSILAIAIDPNNTSTVYAGSYGGGLFRSTDYGNSWVSIGSGLPNTFIQAIAIDPNKSNIILVAPNDAGVFKSEDSGDNWTQLIDGWVNSITIDQTDPTRILVGADGGIFRSIDSGNTWTRGRPSPNHVSTVVFDPFDHMTVYAGGETVFISTDGGASWALPAGEFYEAIIYGITAIALSPASPGQLFVGTQGYGQNYPGNGVFTSLDRGVTWLDANSGPVLDGVATQGVTFAPSDPNILYVAGGYNYTTGYAFGIALSRNRGRSWNSIGKLLNGKPFSFAVDPTSPTTIYAGIKSYGSNSVNGIYKSTDDGATWSLCIGGQDNDIFTGIIIDPFNSAIIYAFSTKTGIYKSADGGKTWNVIYNIDHSSDTFVSQAYVGAAKASPLVQNKLCAGTDRGVICSNDGGKNWIVVNLPVLNQYAPIYSIAFDAINPNLLFAATTLHYGLGNTPIYKSEDGGNSWVNLSDNVPFLSAYALAQVPMQSGGLYAATDRGLFRTSDGGSSWAKVPTIGLPNELGFSTITVSSADPNILYVTASNGQLYTTDPTAAGAPAPASGWWWNPTEPGRGVGLEVSATGAARLGLFGFDDSGFSHWWIASGALDSSGNFSSNLIDAEFGSALGAPQRTAQTSSAGSISFAPTSDTAGTLTLPNGSQVPIQRYEFTPGGLAAAADSAAPRTGWWTSPNAPGQYFFIEVQNGVINASALSFDVDGAPVWYSDRTQAVAAGIYGGSWQELIGGQTLSSPYRAPKALANAASASLRFSSPTSGSLIFGTTILPITWTGP